MNSAPINAIVDSIVAADSFDGVTVATLAERRSFSPAVNHLIGGLPTFHGSLPAVMFAGEALPNRLVTGFGVRMCGVHGLLTSARCFASIHFAEGEVGDAIRALLGALDWKSATLTGRRAILLRAIVEERRGPLPRFTLDQIAQAASDVLKPAPRTGRTS